MNSEYKECDHEGCELPATHTLVWADKWMFMCALHAYTLVTLGKIMGYDTAAVTLRKMTPDEMVPDEVEE